MFLQSTWVQLPAPMVAYNHPSSRRSNVLFWFSQDMVYIHTFYTHTGETLYIYIFKKTQVSNWTKGVCQGHSPRESRKFLYSKGHSPGTTIRWSLAFSPALTYSTVSFTHRLPLCVLRMAYTVPPVLLCLAVPGLDPPPPTAFLSDFTASVDLWTLFFTAYANLLYSIKQNTTSV